MEPRLSGREFISVEILLVLGTKAPHRPQATAWGWLCPDAESTAPPGSVQFLKRIKEEETKGKFWKQIISPLPTLWRASLSPRVMSPASGYPQCYRQPINVSPRLSMWPECAHWPGAQLPGSVGHWPWLAQIVELSHSSAGHIRELSHRHWSLTLPHHYECRPLPSVKTDVARAQNKSKEHWDKEGHWELTRSGLRTWPFLRKPQIMHMMRQNQYTWRICSVSRSTLKK